MQTHRKRISRRQATKTRRQCPSKDKLVKSFMEIINMIKVYHWNTKSFAEHKATDELHERLSKNIDSFVEILLGKDGSRLTKLDDKMALLSLKSKKTMKDKMFQFRKFLMSLSNCLDSNTDTDLLNIRDEILGDVNQFLYLLTLK